MRERVLARAAIAGFAVGVLGLAAVVVTNEDDSPSRLPALSLGGAGREDSAAALAYPAGTIEYRVQGTLPDLPGQARAWSLGRDGETSRIEALARALGLDAPVEAGADGWRVTAGGRSLRVERQPGLPWYFGQDGDGVACTVPAARPGAPATDPDTPVAHDECTSAGGGAAGSVGAGSVGTASVTATTTVICPSPVCPPGSACPEIKCESEPVPVPERPADLPTRAQAEATARGLLEKAGVDLSGAVVHVEDGFSQWLVELDPQVGGLPTLGFGTGVSVGPKGAIDGAHGWLGRPEAGDEYPLVNAAAGVERLKESPFGIGPQPLIAEGPVTCESTACLPPLQVRTITGVRLGLAFAPLLEPGADGRALLVPVFLFDIEDGGVLPVLAVEDEFLPKPVEEPRPGDKPLPEPAPVPGSVPGATEPGVDPGVPEPVTTGPGTEACVEPEALARTTSSICSPSSTGTEPAGGTAGS